MVVLQDYSVHHHQSAAHAGRFDDSISNSRTGKTSDISKSPKQQSLTMCAQIMLKVSDIGDHSLHNAGNENDPLVRQSR